MASELFHFYIFRSIRRAHNIPVRVLGVLVAVVVAWPSSVATPGSATQVVVADLTLAQD